MSAGIILKIIHVYLLATVKYILTFPYALVIGLDFTQTIISVTIGGISGFFFFYHFSGVILNSFNRYKGTIHTHIKKYLFIDLKKLFRKSSSGKPVFNKHSRFFIRLKSNYGFWGIVIATPILLSIPIGAFLLKKYYSREKHLLPYMMVSILGWSLVFTTIAVIIPKQPL
ncbi:MAG: hypothetical protein AB7D05_07055 [Mangrovibacterium sp.]